MHDDADAPLIDLDALQDELEGLEPEEAYALARDGKLLSIPAPPALPADLDEAWDVTRVYVADCWERAVRDIPATLKALRSGTTYTPEAKRAFMSFCFHMRLGQDALNAFGEMGAPEADPAPVRLPPLSADMPVGRLN